MDGEMDTFEAAVAKCRVRDPRFSKGAYVAVKMALDRLIMKSTQAHKELKDVPGAMLAEAFRDYLLETYGPFARDILEEMGITSTWNIGEIVFLMVDAHLLIKKETDSLEDFRNVYDFEEAFTKPFVGMLKQHKAVSKQVKSGTRKKGKSSK